MWRRGFLAGLAGLAGTAASACARTGDPAERQDVALLPASRLAVLEAAVGEMQRRSRADPDDPGGWLANARPHALACSSHGEPRVHGNWWFLPWHRAFLAVTELKLQAISGDAGLRLPYWNWSSDRQIPACFRRPGSPLAQARRFTADRPLRASEVDYPGHDPALARHGVGALAAASFQPDAATAIPDAFGGVAEPHPDGWRGRSRLEGVPHAAIHNYVGGEAGGELGDMTELGTAARDPLFVAHHANLDRLWERWRSDPARRATEPGDPGFASKSFLFAWLDGTPLVVTVGDVLDTRRLGYRYDRLSPLRGGVPPARDPAAAILLAAATLRPSLSVGRATLAVGGLRAGDRPLSAEVTLGPEGDPAAAVTVGGVAIGRKTAAAGMEPDWRFDVTEPLRRFAGGPVVASLWSLPLGGDVPAQDHAGLRFTL